MTSKNIVKIWEKLQNYHKKSSIFTNISNTIAPDAWNLSKGILAVTDYQKTFKDSKHSKTFKHSPWNIFAQSKCVRSVSKGHILQITNSLI